MKTSTKTFGQDAQMSFAEVSGDYNPILVDSEAARRVAFGRTVVHGVHCVLAALDVWLKGETTPVELTSLKIGFRQPAPVGSPVRFEIQEGSRGTDTVLSARAGDSIAMLARCTTRPPLGHPVPKISQVHPVTEQCQELEVEDRASARGKLELALDLEALRRLVPSVLRLLPVWQLATLLSTTRLVGMHCPGRHSVFSQLTLRFDAEGPAGEPILSYSVSSLDHRVNLVTMDIRSLWARGSIRAFVRPRLRAQLDYGAAASALTAGELEWHRALIAGGSRGLGEVAAKIIDAGGGRVTVTYA